MESSNMEFGKEKFVSMTGQVRALDYLGNCGGGEVVLDPQ
jgi:hypothetical protein